MFYNFYYPNLTPNNNYPKEAVEWAQKIIAFESDSVNWFEKSNENN